MAASQEEIAKVNAVLRSYMDDEAFYDAFSGYVQALIDVELAKVGNSPGGKERPFVLSVIDAKVSAFRQILHDLRARYEERQTERENP